MFFLSKKYSKRCDHNTENSNRNRIRATGWRRLVSCTSFIAKEPLIIRLYCGNWPINIKHPMGLRHSGHRPSIKGTKLLIVIKAIIIISEGSLRLNWLYQTTTELTFENVYLVRERDEGGEEGAQQVQSRLEFCFNVYIYIYIYVCVYVYIYVRMCI